MSHDDAYTWELLARGGLRTAFQGLDTSPGLGGIIRDRLRQFRYSRIRHSFDMPASRLCVRPAFMHHPRDMATSRKLPRTLAPGRAKRQRGIRIFFQSAAPLTGFASVRPNPALSSPSLILAAASL